MNIFGTRSKAAFSVIPAKAGIQEVQDDWSPAGVYPEWSRRAGV